MIFEQDAAGVVAMDAQSGDLIAGDLHYWQEIADASASDGVVLKPTGENYRRSLCGAIDYTFKVTTAGAFNLFFRLLTRGRRGVIWVEVDGQQRAVGPDGKNGRLYFATSAYSWQNGYGNALVNLSVGIHTIRVRSLSASVYLDRVAVVPAGSSAITVGSTAVGPAEVGTGTPAPYVKPYTFDDWMRDRSRDQHRVILIDLYHSGGMIGIGSQPYLSEQGVPYDPCLLSVPRMQYSLLSLVDGLGNIEAHLSPFVGDDWKNKDWRGYKCRWYYGDTSWKKADFRLIASATIEDRYTTGARSHRFDLVGDIRAFDRTYTDASSTLYMTVGDAIEWVCEQGGAEPPVFLNMDGGELSKPVEWETSSSSTMYDDIKLIAGSVKAYPRISQTGELEIIKPATDGEPAFVFSIFDTIDQSLLEAGVISAVKNVRVSYGTADASLEDETTASTGTLDEVREFSTALSSSSDAAERLAAEQVINARAQRDWSVRLVHFTNFISVGDYVAFDHDELQGAGVVTSLVPSLDSAVGSIEVRI